MILEIAEYTAQPGKGEALAAGLRQGIGIIRRADGCQSVHLRRCAEQPDRFIAEIMWETLEHHTIRFRGSPQFQEYRSHIAGLFVDPIVVHHYEQIAAV